MNNTEYIQAELMRAREGFSWVVAHVRPKSAWKLFRDCAPQEIPGYLPSRNRTRRYGRKTRSWEVPLFPGYLFVVVNDDQRRWLAQNRYVVTLLDVVDEAKMLKQLRQVRRVLTEGATVDVCPYLKKGEMVRVVTGPFKGMEGLVSQMKGKTRVIINVDMIQQAVAVEVDADSLAPG